jgi:hypothetical protein
MLESVLECRFVGACGGDRSTGLVADVAPELQPTSQIARALTASAAKRRRCDFTMGLQVNVGSEVEDLRASCPESGQPAVGLSNRGARLERTRGVAHDRRIDSD